MAYYFMVESKKGTYIPLEIKQSIYFQTVKTKYTKKVDNYVNTCNK